jgi:hypothetical protein
MGANWGRMLVDLLMAMQPPQPVLERLDPQRRTAVIMAIILMVVIGLILVTCTMLGGRWVRRVARQKPRPSRLATDSTSPEENYSLRESLDGVLPQVNPDETIHTDREKGETKIDP